MSLIKFSYLEQTFIVQSFKDNDFANICQLDGPSFRLDFANKTISTSGKETDPWKNFALKIDFDTIYQKILLQFLKFDLRKLELELDVVYGNDEIMNITHKIMIIEKRISDIYFNDKDFITYNQ